MELTLHPFHLKMKDKFTIAHASREYQDTMVVALTDGEVTGYGEVPVISYYHIDIDFIRKSLEGIAKEVTNLKFSPNMVSEIRELWKHLHDDKKLHPFPHAALDIALYDYYGKKSGLPLWKIFGDRDPGNMVSNYTIGIDTIANMVKKLKAVPWPIYKIKLGTDEDIAMIKALRKKTSVPFRIDANEGWNFEETLKNIEILAHYNIEFIEQPLPRSNLKEMKALKYESPLPLIADENCQNLEDIEKCREGFHGINIKLAKCGGFTPALEMIKQGKAFGLKIMGGCMTESTIGTSAMAQLAGHFDYLDIDGPLLLAEDVGEGVKVSPEGLNFPVIAGIGAIMKEKQG